MTVFLPFFNSRHQLPDGRAGGVRGAVPAVRGHLRRLLHLPGLPRRGRRRRRRLHPEGSRATGRRTRTGAAQVLRIIHYPTKIFPQLPWIFTVFKIFKLPLRPLQIRPVQYHKPTDRFANLEPPNRLTNLMSLYEPYFEALDLKKGQPGISKQHFKKKTVTTKMQKDFKSKISSLVMNELNLGKHCSATKYYETIANFSVRPIWIPIYNTDYELINPYFILAIIYNVLFL